MAQVFELAHVARQVQRGQVLHRGFGQLLRFHAEFARALLQEMAGQQRNVVATFAQRGQSQPDHVQAVKKIFAEQAALHADFQVLVGGGDDAHVGLDRLMSADAVELSVG